MTLYSYGDSVAGAPPAEQDRAASHPQSATLAERRRPGRIAHVNPGLIPLLRSGELSLAAAQLEAAEREPRSDLDPAYGVLVAALSNALFWAVLIFCLSN